jgi:uncharacterized protein YecE (DUF72 family)
VAMVRVGISGWAYAGWRGAFYPSGLRQRDELRYAAERLSSIEINGSFYSLQRPSSYRRWHDETPDDFVFAIKGGRFITHMKRLVDVDTPLANFLASGPLALGRKLGPFLWQLPPTLAFDADRVAGFLDLLPTTVGAASELASRHDERLSEAATTSVVDSGTRLRHAVEVRHRTFADGAARALFRAHGVAVVLADSAGRWPVIDQPAPDFAYVRLHGASELYTSGYLPAELDRWAARIRAWLSAGRDVYVYFDNDAKVHAPRDAQSLVDRLG